VTESLHRVQLSGYFRVSRLYAEAQASAHVELDLAVGQHVRPEQGRESAPVLDGEHVVPLGSGEQTSDSIARRRC
jgi:hypothetical protein